MFIKVEAMCDMVRDPGELRYSGVVFAKTKLSVWEYMILVNECG